MYKRVIPRDFFNEAKLLKCLGTFALNAERYQEITTTEDDECGPFSIELSDAGELYCVNYTFALNGELLFLFTPYNSKSNYPLYARGADDDIEVFTENGEFSEDFKNLINKKDKNNGMRFL